MAKFTDDSVLDAALDDIATCVTLTACSAQPANFAGIAAVALATYTLTAGDGGGDYVIAAGDTSGRKLTVGAQSGNNVTTTGTATHVCLDDGVIMKYATTTTSQGLTSGNPWTTPAFDIEFLDVTP